MRAEAGYLLRCLQSGELLSMPESRPMPVIGTRVHELRIRDRDAIWRIVYRLDPDAVVIAAVFQKKTQATPPGAAPMIFRDAVDEAASRRRDRMRDVSTRRLGRRFALPAPVDQDGVKIHKCETDMKHAGRAVEKVLDTR